MVLPHGSHHPTSFFLLIIELLKKLFTLNSQDHLELLCGSAGEPLFFKQRDGPYIPVLRLLHKCKKRKTLKINRNFK